MKKQTGLSPSRLEQFVSTIYVLHPGFVKSWTDGEEHFIDAPTLARLYGVDLHKCMIVEFDKPESTLINRIGDNKVRHLYPSGNGQYVL